MKVNSLPAKILVAAFAFALLPMSKSGVDQGGGYGGQSHSAPASEIRVHASRIASSLHASDFDGRWWAGASKDERTGFVIALDDCFSFDRKPQTWFHGSLDEASKNIDTAYASARSPLDESALAVFMKLRTSVRKKMASDVDVESERMDDEFWNARSEEMHHGFLEGFFACSVSHEQALRWSKPLDYYRSRLDDMFNYKDARGVDASQFEGTVAAALEKLRDPKDKMTPAPNNKQK